MAVIVRFRAIVVAMAFAPRLFWCWYRPKVLPPADAVAPPWNDRSIRQGVDQYLESGRHSTSEVDAAPASRRMPGIHVHSAQLDWRTIGTARAAACGADPALIVDTWSIDEVLAWTAAAG
jgi:hypothetical protein